MAWPSAGATPAPTQTSPAPDLKAVGGDTPGAAARPGTVIAHLAKGPNGQCITNGPIGVTGNLAKVGDGADVVLRTDADCNVYVDSAASTTAAVTPTPPPSKDGVTQSTSSVATFTPPSNTGGK
jgi:hypothetical protein